MEFEKTSLYNFINSLPTNDKDQLISMFRSLANNEIQFDEFFYLIPDFVDLTRISSFDLIAYLSLLPNDAQFMGQIINESYKYLFTLFGIPDVLDENYTEGRLKNDLKTFLMAGDFRNDWYERLIQELEKNEDVVSKFVEVFYEISKNITIYNQIEDCIFLLQNFQRLITPTFIRIKVAKSDLYYDIIKNLFSFSVFPTDSLINANSFFSKLPVVLTKDVINLVDSKFSNYQNQLTNILRIFLRAATSDETFKIIVKAIKECSVVSKSAFAYSNANQNKGIEAFCINMENVLVSLSILLKNKYQNINPYLPYFPDSIVPLESISNTLSEIDETHDDEWKELVKKNTTNNPGTVSYFFYLTVKAIDNMSCSLFRLNQIIYRRIVQVEEILEMYKNDHSFIIEAKRKELENLKINLNVFNSFLYAQTRIYNILDFTTMCIDYLLYISNINYNNYQEKPNLQYAHLPDNIISSITITIESLLIGNAIKQPYLYTQKLALLFSGNNYIKSQEHKSRIIRIFSIISENKDIQDSIISIPKILDVFFPSLLEFYCSIQIQGQNSSLSERFQYRIDCIKLIKYLFDFQDFRSCFSMNIENKLFKQFIYFVVDDTMYFADHILDLLKTIYIANQDNRNEINLNLNEEIQNEISLSRNNLHYWLSLCNFSIKLMVQICSFAPNYFHDELAKVDPNLNLIRIHLT